MTRHTLTKMKLSAAFAISLTGTEQELKELLPNCGSIYI